MRRPAKIKICGITSATLAAQVAELAVDYIGVVLEPASVRAVDLQQTKAIINAVEPYKVPVVAVVTDNQVDQLQRVYETTGITIFQLHGEQVQQAAQQLPEHLQRIYVLSADEQTNVPADYQQARDLLLYDNKQPGSGQRFAATQLNSQQPFFVAGGLSAENVEQVIKQFKPYGVDVSSGVEQSPGNKDIKLIKEFIMRAKAC